MALYGYFWTLTKGYDTYSIRFNMADAWIPINGMERGNGYIVPRTERP